MHVQNAMSSTRLLTEHFHYLCILVLFQLLDTTWRVWTPEALLEIVIIAVQILWVSSWGNLTCQWLSWEQQSSPLCFSCRQHAVFSRRMHGMVAVQQRTWFKTVASSAYLMHNLPYVLFQAHLLRGNSVQQGPEGQCQYLFHLSLRW